jgi:hypothetical protein
MGPLKQKPDNQREGDNPQSRGRGTETPERYRQRQLHATIPKVTTQQVPTIPPDSYLTALTGTVLCPAPHQV